MTETKTIAVLGLGYVGCVTAACLADIGHQVIGTDRDESKVRNIRAGRPPFYEPGLEALVAENIATGRLSATTSTAEAISNADVALICVGTPSERNGDVSLDQLRRVVDEIAGHSKKLHKRLIVVVRSTVIPGTCEEVVRPAFDATSDVGLVSNPEFLREGSAVRDFRAPSLLVVGGSDFADVRGVAELYAPLGVSACMVSLRTAEMIKYACNAFHAVKISFANEIGSLARSLGVNGQEVMDTLCQDDQLNISPAYLRPGFAFGGSCLPKDLRALTYRASRQDLTLPLLDAAIPSNNAHLWRAIQSVLDIEADRIGIIGLAFKENTDDLRESPVIRLLEHLIGKGRNLRVYDPHIQLESIHGTNRTFVLNAIPHIGRLLETRPEGVLNWAQHLVVAQKPSSELLERIRMSRLDLTDLVGCGLDDVQTRFVERHTSKSDASIFAGRVFTASGSVI
jgi:GDP-mannose 6-dehydrogenase